MRQKRIFHLIKSLGQGGAEMLLRDGLQHCDRTRFTYGYGYFLPWKNVLAPALQNLGAHVECFHAGAPAAMVASIPDVAAFLNQWNADLVHCHLPLAGVVGRLAGRISGIPVVYTEHNLMESYHPATRWLNIRTWRFQKRALAVSQDVQDSIVRHVGESVPVELVLNGVSVASFSPDPEARVRIRCEQRIPKNAMVIGIVAVLRPSKNLMNWLEAAVLIRQKYPSAHFLIVGDGVMRAELEAGATQLGLNDCVHFAGFQHEVRPYLAAMDVYMISSNFEGLPVALLEAMAMNLPVVATRVGGIPEVIVDGETGFLVEPRSAAALAGAVDNLLQDPARMSAFGEAGRARVESNFDIGLSIRHIERIYEEILDDNHQ